MIAMFKSVRLIVVCGVAVALGWNPANANPSVGSVPHYDHILVIVEEVMV